MKEPFIERRPGKLRVGDTVVTADRFPWQAGYNWHGMLNSTLPLNQPREGEKAAPRFGGGWKYRLGLSFSGRTLMLDLLFGIVRIYREPASERERRHQYVAERMAALERQRAWATRAAESGRAASGARPNPEIPF